MLSLFQGEKRPFLLELRSSKWLIVTTISLAVFTDIFLYGVIVPVVPFALISRAGVDPENVQYWTSVLIAIYGAAVLVASPIFGYVADATTTRRAPLLSGLIVLAGATGLLCAGTSIGLWVAGRILQGISAAVVWTVGLAMLVDTVGKQEVGRYLGYISLALSLAILAAPLLGGVVYDRGGYYAVFAMCFALLGLDIFLRLFMIEKRTAARWLTDAEQKLQQGQTSVSVEDSASSDNEKGTTSPISTEEPDAHQSATIETRRPNSLVRTVSSIKKPKVPPIFSLLKSSRLLAALYGGIIQAVLLTSFDSTLPIRVRSLFEWSSLGAGLIFLPIALPAFASPLVGWLCDRYGPRYITMLAWLLAVPPLVCLRFVEENTIHDKVLICALLAIIGFCLSSTLPPLMAEIMHVVDAREAAKPGVFGPKGAYAQAYGLYNMAFSIGCLIGPLWGGMIQEVAGWGTMAWTLGLLSGVSAVPTLLWVGGWIGTAKWERKDVSNPDAGRTIPV